jgi:hypothetical protein
MSDLASIREARKAASARRLTLTEKDVEPQVTPLQLEVARQAYFDALTIAAEHRASMGNGDPGNQWREAMGQALQDIELDRLSYEGVREGYQRQQRDREAEIANKLARTNTDLAGKQTWLAAAIAVFTCVQVFLAALDYAGKH